jgi:hypothetical protein
MEATIENIASLAAIGNLAVNQLMERKVTTTIIAKAASAKESKWTMVMAKNVRHVVRPSNTWGSCSRPPQTWIVQWNI